MKKKTAQYLFGIALGILIYFCSCTPAKHIHSTGTYKIATRKGNVTTFEGIKGKYLVLSDTLKPGHRITINVIHLMKYRN